MRILIRLPNWLGDMVMSVAFVRQVQHVYPEAKISVIAKKGLEDLLKFFPMLEHHYIFSKDKYPGLKGAFKFGKSIRKEKTYDLFFCLPDSFSSAVMAYATGAKQRIGYKNEMRSGLLTTSFNKMKDLHRVDEYLDLLSSYTGKSIEQRNVKLDHNTVARDKIIINVNSEAQSRRLPDHKAVQLIQAVRRSTKMRIELIGGPKDEDHVKSVYNNLEDRHDVHVVAGKSTLTQLAENLASARVILTTDSGPAHLANALDTPAVVLFGAGNEKNTAPYNKNNLTIIRLRELPCEPCRSNTCRLFPEPKCLTLLDESKVVTEVLKYL